MSETPDKTLIQNRNRAASPDATRVVSRGRSPAATQMAGAGNEADPATVIAGKSAQAKPSNPGKVAVGTVLKQRFELVTLIGSGGMGAVYKARDLRQVETGDPFPWVALKVINDSFARHEHALVTLQQETKKTQRLAHPNIVSVHDFDREGDIAFMTMELLEGQSLDAVMARKPAGLPYDEAAEIIRQICQAVEYAHKQGIVHADLKPANIFLTRKGRVKILDFGIAQAMQGEVGFDTQQLQALTPAYASVRMLAGQRPQPFDDLYALGCIFYLLLSGKHPFQRKRATEADAAGLKPARLIQLKSNQWKALSRLLQFQPDAGASIEQFQRVFFDEQDHRVRRLYLRGGIALMLLLVLTLGINSYLNRSVRLLADQLRTQDLAQIRQTVADIQLLGGSDRVVVLERARDDIIQAIEQQLAALEAAQDYQHLNQYLALMSRLYPDSSRVQEAAAQFAQKRDAYIADLASALQQRIERRSFTDSPVSFARQVQDLQRVAPDHPLLVAHNLKSLLAQEAGVAVYLGQRETASAILAEADVLFPEEKDRFQQIRSRLERSPTAVAVQPRQDQRQNSSFAAASQLLEQFQLDAQPQQLAAFLQALSKVDQALYFVLRQGIKDFIRDQHQAGNGKAFIALQQQLFGAAPVVALAQQAKSKLDPCQLRMANQGKQRGARCRDSLTRSETGPELVVISASGLPAFAISRFEVSVNDFNLYCRLYRRCTPLPASTLPMTNIDLQQATFYMQWLSRMTGYEYRLPTLKEWQVAARGDSGISDHNCVVNVAGRVVRGNGLRAVDLGYANGLGVLNLFGNAEEWVRDGSRVVLAGGDATTDIAHCNAVDLNEAAPETATPFRGLRLVRELK